jgi:hypothetical protein
MTQKRKRRTKAEILAAKSEGLGDSLEKVFEATGIASAVKFIFGEDCGCDKRKELLNDIFPYRKPNCLTETEYKYLDGFFNKGSQAVTREEQSKLLDIYNRVLNTNKQPSSCGSCVRDMVNQLKRIYNSYANT